MNLVPRRQIVTGLAGAPALALTACAGGEKEVGAVEDLMREHGVLRRAFLVYQECAARLRGDAARVDARAIHDTAKLFRSFGEDYHERKLEERYIFPRVKTAGGPAAAYVDVLEQQHERGRAMTDYILSVTKSGSIGSGDIGPLANVFAAFQIMYANHTAREDTIVFQAWRDALSDRELEETGDKFEDIEKQTFGHDGFDDAVKQIAAIEEALGLTNIAQFTAPPPPH